MIQTKLYGLSQMVENGPVSTTKDDSESNKNQTKSKVQNVVKEDKKQVKQCCLVDPVVQKGTLKGYFFKCFKYCNMA